MIRALLIAAALALAPLSLGGCSAVQTAQTPVGDQTVADARNTIYAVKSGYAITLRAATAYVKLPACEKPGAPTVCSSRDVVVALAKAQDAAKATIDNAEATILRATGASSVLTSAVDAAKSAYSAFKGVTAAYNIKEG